MRIIETKVYQFSELSERAKDRAREWCRDDDGMRGQWAWDQIQEDAENVGLKILSLDDNRPNAGKFIGTALECARKIMVEHGNVCETYKTAARHIDALEAQNEDTIEDAEQEFLHDLLEDYRVMCNKDVEYAYSQEFIDEDIEANEYEFTEEGKRI